MIEMRRRTLAIWIAHHSNGWITAVAENLNGTWSARAAPAGNAGHMDYTTAGLELAQGAALRALQRQTGHGPCAGRCSAWELSR
jgi:hypothetical protein